MEAKGLTPDRLRGIVDGMNQTIVADFQANYLSPNYLRMLPCLCCLAMIIAILVLVSLPDDDCSVTDPDCEYSAITPIYASVGFWAALVFPMCLCCVGVVGVRHAQLSLLAITLCLISAAFIAHKFLYSLHDTIVDTNYAGATDQDSLRWIKQTTGIKPALYGLVANGIPFYATWCVVASHINIGIVLQYEIGLSDDTASIVVLSILSCVILFYWFLDFYKLRLQLRYTYSPYIVLIWAFTGSLTNGGVNVDERASSPFIAALLIVAVLGTIAKVVMGISMRNQPSESPAAETDTLEQV